MNRLSLSAVLATLSAVALLALSLALFPVDGALAAGASAGRSKANAMPPRASLRMKSSTVVFSDYSARSCASGMPGLSLDRTN